MTNNFAGEKIAPYKLVKETFVNKDEGFYASLIMKLP